MSHTNSFDDNPAHPGRETNVMRWTLTDEATGTVLAVFHRRRSIFGGNKEWLRQPGGVIPEDAIAVTDTEVDISATFVGAHPELRIHVRCDYPKVMKP
jgi:hypothetical protein